jgi:Ca2+-transporting ATPase
MTGPPAVTGLTEEETRRRLGLDGPNELPTEGPRRPWRIALEVLREPMFGLLLVGGAIYVALGLRLAFGLDLRHPGNPQ